MGTPGSKANTPRWLPLAFLSLLVGGLGAGCSTDTNPRRVSAEEFLAPEIQSARVLASKLSILKAISPSTLDSELLDAQSRARPLAKTSDRGLLVYEAIQGSTVTVDLCPECSQDEFSFARTTMHWSQDALETELFETWGVVSLDPALDFDEPLDRTTQGVEPVELQGHDFDDWVLVFETSSGSLLAFKEDRDFRPVPPGLSVPENHPNFGFGNGLLMSVVISGSEMAAQLDEASPRISRIFELENGKILCFFTTLRRLHLLELTLEEREIVYDRESGETRTVQVPRGQFRTFEPEDPNATRPDPFLTFRRIQDNVTQTSLIDLDTFQPLFVPPSESAFCEDGGPLPKGGSALIYDLGSSSLILVSENVDPTSERLGRGEARLGASGTQISDALGASAPFDMSEGVFDFGCDGAFIFEETSDNLFRFDFMAQDAAEKLQVTADGVDFLLRREPEVIRGGDEVPSSEDPVLLAAQNNIRESRLYFDGGQDQLLGVHFETSNVVIAANRQDFESVTGSPLTELTWIEALPNGDPKTETIRAFDTRSTSLLEVKIRYKPIPVVDREN